MVALLSLYVTCCALTIITWKHINFQALYFLMLCEYEEFFVADFLFIIFCLAMSHIWFPSCNTEILCGFHFGWYLR